MNNHSHPNQNFELHSSSSLIDRLVDLNELREILGYEDNRSVRSWCNRMKIPLFVLGKRIYTLNNFLEQHLTTAIQKFVDANYDKSTEVMLALKNDEEITINKKVETKKKEKAATPDMSEAAKKFLKVKK